MKGCRQHQRNEIIGTSQEAGGTKSEGQVGEKEGHGLQVWVGINPSMHVKECLHLPYREKLGTLGWVQSKRLED